MHETSEPIAYVPAPQDLLSDDVVTNAREHGDEVGYSRRVGDTWRRVTHAQFAKEVVDLAAGLMAWGLQPGERVAIMAGTSYEWMLCDFAIWTSGGATVPIYETSSAEQVEWILGDSGSVAAFVASDELAATVGGVRASLPDLRDVWLLDERSLGQLVDAGRDVPRVDVEARRTSRTSDDLATIIYTSGTTGRPKGCTITHANLLSSVRNVLAAPNVTELVFNERSRTLLFIPVAHILARVIQLAAVRARVHLAHSSDAKNAAPLLVDFEPTVVLAVPYVFEKIYNTAKHKARSEGKGWIFDRADHVAGAYSEGVDHGGAGVLTGIEHAVFDRLVYAKLRAAIGGHTEYIVSGGAPLGSRLGHFFRGVGINPLEGYGLTETCAGVTLNLPGRQRIGTVGRPLPGVSVRIADDGEVLLKGGQVFAGYWNNDAATADAFDEEGWFRTGDLGALDDDGYLRITGRKKDLIVTSGGKNVAPAVLEDRLRAHWLLSEAVVVGDDRPFVGALLTLDLETLPLWLKEKGHAADAGVATVEKDPMLLASLQHAVDDANLAVSKAEQIKKFRVLHDQLTIESGLLTPTLKVKRAAVLKRFAPEIDELYAKDESRTG
ncbi:long-chain fatty acid--CoA ligase [Intrasporangium oryzae NRRL B-24470]|uniref:Long-chain fatty acid--CoA ligase n=1 Tax=Intrasporangium oryzae NRRL B-24470 TaxID=1386089 RepID=W9G161_9MICO|nr:long-chain fatty acid--CoA ligase [Intrasporangium oryzae]EWS99674.1 long-chain fatty acid--CoA ligase [Intrasporangium oryzae NRRL B-24470]